MLSDFDNILGELPTFGIFTASTSRAFSVSRRVTKAKCLLWIEANCEEDADARQRIRVYELDPDIAWCLRGRRRNLKRNVSGAITLDAL